MTILFSLHLANHRKGFGKPSVRAVQAKLAGVYIESLDITVKPDMKAVREALPHYYRKAFDRSLGFWFNKEARFVETPLKIGVNHVPYMHLVDARNNIINTIYALPYRLSSD